MAKKAKRKAGKSHGLTETERNRIAAVQSMRREVRNEQRLARLSRQLVREVFKRDTAIENMVGHLIARQTRLDASPAPEVEK